MMTAQNIVIFGDSLGDGAGCADTFQKLYYFFQKFVFEIQKNRFIYYDSIAKKLSEK